MVPVIDAIAGGIGAFCDQEASLRCSPAESELAVRKR
jgi:hypothetical protein